ncbi:Anthranilate synthase [Streptococcus thermophilus CNCM I-1630]|nr:Anthranilate synthase [Streptococcus thermophilus CNCM I-1630]
MVPIHPIKESCISLITLDKLVEGKYYEKNLPADTLTPILAYMRVQGEHKVILESIPREKENARFFLYCPTIPFF